MNIIDRLKNLEDKATEGEWRIAKETHPLATFTSIKGGIPFNRFGGSPCVVGSGSFTRRSGEESYEVFGPVISDEDAELIVTMRNALPALLKVVEAAQESVKEGAHYKEVEALEDALAELNKLST